MTRKFMTSRGLAVLIFAIGMFCSSCTNAYGERSYEKGVLAYESEEYQKAADYFLDALDRNPDRAEYYLYYGYTLLEMDSPKEAEEQFKRVILPKDIPFVRENTKRALRGAGIAAFLQQEYETASEYFEKAAQMPELSELNSDIEAYRQRIEVLQLAKRLSEAEGEGAIRLCQELEKKNGESEELSVLLGNLYRGQEEYEASAQEFLFAAGCKENSPLYLAAGLDFFRASGKTEEESEIQKLCALSLEALDKANRDVLTKEQREGMGWLYFALGEYEKAYEILKGEDAADCDFRDCIRLAYLAYQQKDISQMEQFLMAASEPAKNEDFALETVAEEALLLRMQIYMSENQGDYAKAHQEIKRYLAGAYPLTEEEKKDLEKELSFLNYRNQ